MITYTDFMTESSLNRIRSKLKEHDAGAMTAFRGDNTKSVNKDKNVKLMNYLISKGYSVTKVKGSYIEQYGTEKAREVGEETLFIVDHNDAGTLKADLIKLGKLYDQDSVLWIPKGETAMLIGTSHRDEAFPSFGQVHKFSGSEWGKASGAFFSRIKGRQFSFTEGVDFEDVPFSLYECEYPKTINGIRGMTICAEEIERAIKEAGD